MLNVLQCCMRFRSTRGPIEHPMRKLERGWSCFSLTWPQVGNSRSVIGHSRFSWIFMNFKGYTCQDILILEIHGLLTISVLRENIRIRN